MGGHLSDTTEKESSYLHKILSVILRTFEFASACIVLGILCRFCYLLSITQTSADGRIVYTMVVAGIAIVYSFFFCAPFDALFSGFPVDFVLFIMWLVAFCLLETKTGTSTCTATWFNNYWGYYWGRFWYVGPVGTVNVNRAGCSQWRAVLAFSFMTCFAHLLSGFLGVYVFHEYVQIKKTARSVKRQAEKMAGRRHHDTNGDHTREMETGQVDNGSVPPPAPTSAPNPPLAA